MATALRTTTIDISKENLKFSGAHFTVFSATERERLHGHNFKVRATITAPVDQNGLCFDYQEIKLRLKALCEELDEYLLLPAHSPFLTIEENGAHYTLKFADETMCFLRSDTLLLPVRNATVEEFSDYILQRLIKTDNFFVENDVRSITVGVSSGDGQWGSSSWAR